MTNSQYCKDREIEGAGEVFERLGGKDEPLINFFKCIILPSKSLTEKHEVSSGGKKFPEKHAPDPPRMMMALIAEAWVLSLLHGILRLCAGESQSHIIIPTVQC